MFITRTALEITNLSLVKGLDNLFCSLIYQISTVSVIVIFQSNQVWATVTALHTTSSLVAQYSKNVQKCICIKHKMISGFRFLFGKVYGILMYVLCILYPPLYFYRQVLPFPISSFKGKEESWIVEQGCSSSVGN